MTVNDVVVLVFVLPGVASLSAITSSKITTANFEGSNHYSVYGTTADGSRTRYDHPGFSGAIEEFRDRDKNGTFEWWVIKLWSDSKPDMSMYLYDKNNDREIDRLAMATWGWGESGLGATLQLSDSDGDFKLDAWILAISGKDGKSTVVHWDANLDGKWDAWTVAVNQEYSDLYLWYDSRQLRAIKEIKKYHEYIVDLDGKDVRLVLGDSGWEVADS